MSVEIASSVTPAPHKSRSSHNNVRSVQLARIADGHIDTMMGKEMPVQGKFRVKILLLWRLIDDRDRGATRSLFASVAAVLGDGWATERIA